MKKLLLLLTVPFLSFGQYDCDYLISYESYVDLNYNNSISNYNCYNYIVNQPWYGYTVDMLIGQGYACECVEPLGGCTDDVNATNYDPGALYNDGSCEYECSYLLDIQSVYDLGSSVSSYYCYTYATNETYTIEYMEETLNYNCDCVEIYGCTDPLACNFSPFATIDEGCGVVDNCGTCDDDPSNDCEFECDVASLTYVPDDSFENYIETNFPYADNGASDNYVFTAGLNFDPSDNVVISFSEANLDDPIFDLTGIENFKGLTFLTLSGSSVLVQNLDLSCLELSNNPNADVMANNSIYAAAQLSISNCMFLENLILPSDTFNLTINGNAKLENVEFQPGAYYSSIAVGNAAYGNNEALCYLNIKGNALHNNFQLSVYDNYYVYNEDATEDNGMSIDLLEFNSTYGVSAYFYDYYSYLENSFPWQVRFNEEVYDWTSVNFNWYSNNNFCVDVADPAYAEAYWPSYSNLVDYSANCWSTSNINCPNLVSIQENVEGTQRSPLRVVDILGREANNKEGFQLHIYDDGSVEKKYLIK